MSKIAERIAVKLTLYTEGWDLEDFATLSEFDRLVWKEVRAAKTGKPCVLRKEVMSALAEAKNMPE